MVDQIKNFRLQALFRAIFVVIEHCGEAVEGYRVHLVKTGRYDGLSEAISFGSIRQEADGPFNPTKITADFETALDFLLALERKEADVGCSNVEHFELDRRLGDTESEAVSPGYSSGPIHGPSTLWTTDEFRQDSLELSELVRKQKPFYKSGLPSVLMLLRAQNAQPQ